MYIIQERFWIVEKLSEVWLSRYKLKQKYDDTIEEIEKHGPPMKVMWYLPIIPRMKRLFANPNDTKNLRWHVDERKCDGMYQHPADSIQWKKFDDEFPEFGKESRNIWLGFAIDGMNSFGNMSTNYSSWPVLLVIYNLPSELCMKQKYMMLLMSIYLFIHNSLNHRLLDYNNK